jgi:phosphomannomutase / phosphoglucomutase
MKSTIFRHYDIRGEVGTDFDLGQVYNLGYAIAYYFLLKKPDTKTVLVGMDGRIHSPQIREQLCAALQESGLDVLDIGLCPVPVLYYGLHTLAVDAGIMITASHNPPEYNGLKICLGTESIWGDQIQEIAHLYEQQMRITDAIPGTYQAYDLSSSYRAQLEHDFAHLKGNPLPMIFDCGNGAVGTLIPELIKKMDWSHAAFLYDTVDGRYPNHEADPTIAANMEDLKKMVIKSDAQVGIGFDGDGDRMAAMTHEGRLLSGDTLLAIFAYHILKEQQLAGTQGSVVFDIRSSKAVAEVIEQQGGKAYRSAAGHASIKADMKRYGALLGGELSCHFMFEDRYFGFDDGIYAAFRLIELIITTGKSLAQLQALVPQTHSSQEYRISCDPHIRHTMLEKIKTYFKKQKDAKLLTIDGIFVELPTGWGLVRLSHTQPVISLRFEADSAHDLVYIKSLFASILRPYLSENLDNILGLSE